MSLDSYKAKLWKDLPPTPKSSGKKIRGTIALRLGFNKYSHLVGKLYISRGPYYNPAVDLTKTAAVQSCIGTLTAAGTDFLNKELEGEKYIFTNVVFDEILGKIPGSKVVQQMVKTWKLGNSLANTSAPVQVRDGDRLWLYEMATKNPNKKNQFNYVRTMMIVDPYRRSHRSSWAIYTTIEDLRIFEAPATWRTPKETAQIRRAMTGGAQGAAR